jgi:hypothetical protein
MNEFDSLLLSPQYLADPYSVYRNLREQAPVVWSERMDGWVITRYGDVKNAFRDPRLNSGQRLRSYMRQFPRQLQEDFKPLYEMYTKWLVMMDPPDHTRLRTLVNKAFTPRMVAGLAPRIESLFDDLCESWAATKQFELIGDLAYPLPAMMISEMLGIPTEDRQQFHHWADELTAFLGSGAPQIGLAEAASQAVQQLNDYLRPIIANRRSEPCDDLISKLVKIEEQGEKISSDELLAMSVFLLVAGHETTMALIANGVWALLQNRRQLEQLKQDKSLLPSAVEEFLRYDSPLQHQIRVVSTGFVLGEELLEPGQRVVLMLGAANRDPEQFREPDSLVLDRSPNQHLAFGEGRHFCLGAPLARLEAKIVFENLLGRFPNLKAVDQTVSWRKDTSLRHPSQVWVTL